MFTDDYGNRRFPGLYRGLVFDNRDPLGRGRVRLQVPQVLGDAITDWAWSQYTPGVQHHEPAVGAGIWVQFEGGDPSYPVWTAGFTSDGSVDYLQLNPEWQNGSTEIGRLAWSSVDETPEVKVGNGEVTLQIGQEHHRRVANGNGEDILAGDVVYYSGGVNAGGHPYVAKYLADGTYQPFRVVGVATQTIPVDGEGLVTVDGKVRDLDTSSYAPGDVLYASTTEYGGWQTTLATAPDDIVAIGVVGVSDANNGEIVVTINPLINQLQTNLVFFPTTTASDVLGYFRLVNSTLDPDFDEPAVEVTTGTLSVGTTLLLGQLIADANEFVGNPGTVEMVTTGAIGKTFGNSNTSASFYFRVYRRTSLGVETLLGESSKTSSVAVSGPAPIAPTQFSTVANVVFETFSNTDRLVVRFFADVVEEGAQAYTFTYGGVSPVRVLLPVPVNVVSTPSASGVVVDTTNFAGNLSSADNTVQKALDTIDDLAFGGGGQVTVSSTPPTSPTPAEGDIWVSDTDGASYVYYTDGTSNQWMQIGASTAAYPPAAFLDVLSFSLTATVTKIPVSTSATPMFVHPEIIASATTDSFQVTKSGYYEFGFEGAATSVESGNRVALQSYVSTTSPPATAGAAYRDVRTFDSAVAAGTIAVNGSWFAYLTPTDYVAFYASCNTTDGALSTSGQVYIRRIG